MYFLYSTLLALGAILTTPYWLYKALRERKYQENFTQRLGWKVPSVNWNTRPLWIHAVSVGEVLAARALVAAIRQARADLPIILSTVTLTGQALAKKEISSARAVFYFPFDWDFSIGRFLETLQPCAVILVETELWPNFLKGCSRRGIPVFLVNGRLSDASFRRYRRAKKLMKRVLADLAVIGVQSHEDRRRFLELGAMEEQIIVTGNLKFDFPNPGIDRNREILEQIRAGLALEPDSPIIVVGSSMKGEETLFLDAFRQVRQAIPRARLILAPRHPERFDEVADLLSGFGMPFLRRSRLDGKQTSPAADILLLDTIGELHAVYSLASVAVIGGSFLPYGGHNLLEPAMLGKAILFGPEMSNFREMSRTFLREQAVRQSSPQSLPAALIELLQNARARNLLGQRAASTFRQNQGATHNTLEFLLPRVP